jgi:hypothetical protein
MQNRGIKHIPYVRADQKMKSLESEQNMNFPENMMEVTRFESFLDENNLIPSVEGLET